MSLSPLIREKIDAYMLQHKMRRTRQREVIIEAAFQSDEHYTADEPLSTELSVC